MKIAFLINDFPKISETFILNQIIGMIDRGHEIEIYARNDPREADLHDDVMNYNLRSKTNYIGGPDNKINRISNCIRLIAQGVLYNPNRVIESLRIRKYGRDALSLRLLHSASQFSNSNFDVMYCHFGPNGNLGALLKQTGIDAPLVTMFHGYDVRLGIRKGGRIYQPLFEHGDLIISNSKHTQHELIKLGADPENIITHPVGINPDLFTNSVDQDSEPIVITTVGRLVKEKGYEYSIQAINRVIQSVPNRNIQYQIVGDGPEKESLQKLVSKLNIEKSVKFYGQVSRSKVIDLLGETNIFILSSVEEGLGTVLLEAQASGVPIVATETGGIPQAVARDKSAILVPPKNTKELAAQIERLCKNPKLRSKMGNAGLEYIERNFDINNLNDELEVIFYDLINGAE